MFLLDAYFISCAPFKTVIARKEIGALKSAILISNLAKRERLTRKVPSLRLCNKRFRFFRSVYRVVEWDADVIAEVQTALGRVELAPQFSVTLPLHLTLFPLQDDSTMKKISVSYVLL